MKLVVDYEAEYNNRARVPDHPAVIAGWIQDAQAYRQRVSPRTLHYGHGERHSIDLFSARGEGAIVAFIHGGYWQSLDASYFSHLAAGLNAHGIDVAIPNYQLCPAVSVQQIIGEMQGAAGELAKLGRPLVVSGHSAGGHLAACLLATDWRRLDAALPADLVRAAFTISGLFDLAPLVGTSINKALQLDPAAARQASPMFWPEPSHGSLDAVVGGDESGEYFRQSRDIVERWGAAGVATRFDTVPSANHFTAIAPLADPESAMSLRLRQLAML